MLVSVLRDLHSTLQSLASIFSRTRQFRYLSSKESITIIRSAPSLAHLRCATQFRALVLRLMHGQVWARFSAAAKETNFTRKDRRTHSRSMRRPTISAPKRNYSVNSVPVSKFGSRGTSVGL